MTLWLDAQLPPQLAAWINAQGWDIEAVAVREIEHLREGEPWVEIRQASTGDAPSG